MRNFIKIHPINDFLIFLKVAIRIMTIFVKNVNNHIQGEFVKIPKLIFTQKRHFRPEIENLEMYLMVKSIRIRPL